MALGSSAKTKINHPLRNPCVNCVLDPAAFLGFVCCACHASELPVYCGLLEEGMCPEMPTGKVGSRKATLRPCLGSSVALSGWGGDSSTTRMSRNCPFLLFWPLAWDLCNEAVPCWAGEVWCTFLLFCTIWVTVSIFFASFHFAEINHNVAFVLR